MNAAVDTLVTERQELRDVGASPAELEENRLLLVVAINDFTRVVLSEHP